MVTKLRGEGLRLKEPGKLTGIGVKGGKSGRSGAGFSHGMPTMRVT